MLHDAGGGGGINFSRKKRYEGVRSNVISVTSGWVSNFQKKSVTQHFNGPKQAYPKKQLKV